MRKKSFKAEVFAEMRRADGTRELIFNASLNSVFGRAGRSAADRALPTGRGAAARSQGPRLRSAPAYFPRDLRLR